MYLHHKTCFFGLGPVRRSGSRCEDKNKILSKRRNASLNQSPRAPIASSPDRSPIYSLPRRMIHRSRNRRSTSVTRESLSRYSGRFVGARCNTLCRWTNPSGPPDRNEPSVTPARMASRFPRYRGGKKTPATAERGALKLEGGKKKTLNSRFSTSSRVFPAEDLRDCIASSKLISQGKKKKKKNS